MSRFFLNNDIFNGFPGNRVGDELLAVNDEVVTNDRHVTMLQLFADMPATSELPITLVGHTKYEFNHLAVKFEQDQFIH